MNDSSFFKLLPCMFCGHKKPRFLRKTMGRYSDKIIKTYVQCPKCYSGGPYHNTEEKSAEKWNLVPRSKNIKTDLLAKKAAANNVREYAEQKQREELL